MLLRSLVYFFVYLSYLQLSNTADAPKCNSIFTVTNIESNNKDFATALNKGNYSYYNSLGYKCDGDTCTELEECPSDSEKIECTSPEEGCEKVCLSKLEDDWQMSQEFFDVAQDKPDVFEETKSYEAEPTPTKYLELLEVFESTATVTSTETVPLVDANMKFGFDYTWTYVNITGVEFSDKMEFKVVPFSSFRFCPYTGARFIFCPTFKKDFVKFSYTHMKYCPHCGRPVKVKSVKFNEEAQSQSDKVEIPNGIGAIHKKKIPVSSSELSKTKYSHDHCCANCHQKFIQPNYIWKKTKSDDNLEIYLLFIFIFLFLVIMVAHIWEKENQRRRTAEVASSKPYHSEFRPSNINIVRVE